MTAKKERALYKGAKLKSALAVLLKTGEELREEIHLIACSVCVEAITTGNLTHLLQLDAATANLGQRELRRWLAKHGPVKWDTKQKRFVFADAKREAAVEEGSEAYGSRLLDGPTYVEEATETDADPFKAFDIPSMLRSIAKRRDNVEDPSDARHDFTGLDELYELVNKLPVKIKPKADKKAKAPAKVTVAEASTTVN